MSARVRPAGRVKFVRGPPDVPLATDSSYKPPPPRQWGQGRSKGESVTKEVVDTRLVDPLLAEYLAYSRAFGRTVPLPQPLYHVVMQSPFLKRISLTRDKVLVLRRPEDVIKLLPPSRLSEFELAGYHADHVRLGAQPVRLAHLERFGPAFQYRATGLGNQSFRVDSFVGTTVPHGVSGLPRGATRQRVLPDW